MLNLLLLGCALRNGRGWVTRPETEFLRVLGREGARWADATLPTVSLASQARPGNPDGVGPP
jgi:hypothetical protein